METMSHWKVLPDNYNPSWGGYEMLGSGTAASVRIISILSTCLDSAGGEMRLKRSLTLIIVICCLQTWSLLRQICRQTCEWQKVELVGFHVARCEHHTGLQKMLLGARGSSQECFCVPSSYERACAPVFF